MSTINQIRSSPWQRPILWKPTFALASVNGSIVLSWIIYRVHLAALLTKFGFPATFAPTLLLIESLLAIGIEPLAGSWSDRAAKQRNTRFGLIAFGVVSTALLFLGIPVLAGLINPVGVVPWALLGLLIIWAIAISLFRSPALALLKYYAPTTRLPQAASLLTLVSGIAGAATPLGSQLILGLGTGITFTAAAILLVATGLWLRSTHPETELGYAVSERPRRSLSIVQLGLIFAVGLAATLAFRLVIESFPKILKAQIPGVQPPLLIGLIFITLGLAALPVGKFATRLGNRRAMILGTAIAAAFLGLMLVAANLFVAVLIALGLGIAFSLISNGTLPFVLALVQSNHAGLGVGLFFGGAAAANSLYMAVLGRPGLSPIQAVWLGTLALLIVGVCVAIGNRLETHYHPEPPI